MPIAELLIAHAIPFLLVAFRLAGLMIFSPILAMPGIPRQTKVLLTLMAAAAVYPGVAPAAQVEPDVTLLGLLPLVVWEAAIGAALGLIAMIPIVSLDLAGLIMGNQMGLGLARVYNPETDTDSEALGQLTTYLGMSAFVALGGLESLYLCIVRSFDRVPIGAFGAGDLPLEMLVGVIASGFELALRVATPVIAIILLILAAMGALMKTMPQFNVLTIGFAIKILAGVFVFAGAVSAIHAAAGEEISRVLTDLSDWISALGATRE